MLLTTLAFTRLLYGYHPLVVPTALALLATAAGVLAWRLLSQKSEGKPRCRKCWYILAGVEADTTTGALMIWSPKDSKLRCPECGHDNANARDLTANRVPPIFAFLAAALLAPMFVPLAYVLYAAADHALVQHKLAPLRPHVQTLDRVLGPHVWFNRPVRIQLTGQVPATAFARLSGLESLRTLALADVTITGQADFDDMQLTGLMALTVDGGNINDEHLAFLASARNLHTLEIVDAPITDATLARLANHRQLRDLSLQGTQVTGAGLAALPDPDELLFLDLQGSAFDSRQAAHLARFTKLSYFNLAGTQADDSVMEHVAQLSKLEFLELSNTQVTGAGLKHLATLDQLGHLSLANLQIVDSDFDAFDPANMPRSLVLKGCPITGAMFARIDKEKSLGSLDLEDTLLDDEGLRHIAAHVHWGHFNFAGTRITDAGLAHFALPPPEPASNEPEVSADRPDAGDDESDDTDKLTIDDIWGPLPFTLNLSRTRITSDGLRHMRGWNISILSLDCTSVDAAAFEHLAAIRGMGSLSLRHTPITLADIPAMVEHLKKVGEIDLFGTPAAQDQDALRAAVKDAKFDVILSASDDDIQTTVIHAPPR